MIKVDANCVQYGSNKLKRIARYVLVAEIHALLLGFSMVCAVRGLLEDMMGRDVAMEKMVDSKAISNVIARDGMTEEKRLKTFVPAL